MNREVPVDIEKDEFWKETCGSLFKMMPSFSPVSDKVRRNPVARLIGWLPYLAKTDQPERDSITNLTVYLMASYGSSKEIFSHSKDDSNSVYVCLSSLMNFTRGNEELLCRGLSLISMVLLNHYQILKKDDQRQGRINPLNTGAWDYAALMKELEDNVNSVPCRKMDHILNLESISLCYWNP